MRRPGKLRRRGAWLLATAILAAAFLYLRTPPAPDVTAAAPDASAGPVAKLPAPAAAALRVGPPAAPARAPIANWQILLLPDAGVEADPDSVRIGLAAVSDEDLATHLGGAEGAGPVDAGRFAQVRSWRSLPATRQPDGAVRVGPLTLEGADRYVLQAGAVDPLHQYHADFAADSAPASVLPLAGAGLRVRRDTALQGEVTLLLRRSGALLEAERWQSLLLRHPGVAAAFDEQPWPLNPGVSELAPLPPQSVEALILVDGIEAQRQAFGLAPGQWSELSVDPIAHAVARQLAVELSLRLVRNGSESPVVGVEVIWQHERGERRARSDVGGRVRFPGVDRQREQSFELRFPQDTAELPSWPESRTLSLNLDELYPEQRAARRIEHRVQLDRLDWLLASSATLLLDPARNAGQPYPVYVLQQRSEGAWLDTPAEYFRKVDDGLAVSLIAAGEYRVAVALTPWSVLYSGAVDTRRIGADAHHRVRVEALPGRSVELILAARGVPLPRAQVLMPGPLRGLPPLERVADTRGHLRLDGVTVDTLLVEVPGHAQQNVDLRGPWVQVNLVPDADGVPDGH